jgi:hypothetical protein
MPAIHKDGWNKQALLLGPIWYLGHKLILKGLIMLLICAATLGIAIIPVWIYSGWRANRDLYRHLKKNNVYIY